MRREGKGRDNKGERKGFENKEKGREGEKKWR